MNVLNDPATPSNAYRGKDGEILFTATELYRDFRGPRQMEVVGALALKLELIPHWSYTTSKVLDLKNEGL